MLNDPETPWIGQKHFFDSLGRSPHTKKPHSSSFKKWGSKSPCHTFPPGKRIGERISGKDDSRMEKFVNANLSGGIGIVSAKDHQKIFSDAFIFLLTGLTYRYIL